MGVPNMKNKYIYTIIESVSKKSIEYIADNPKRGVRNLLDFGEYFAVGRFQKSFFDIAHEILINEDSFYYDKVENLVANTDHETMTKFGINLGYHSFTYGANKLREHEKDMNCRIPWTIVFDFRKKSENPLTNDEISDIIKNAKNYGIYCFIILLDDNDILMELYPIVEEYQDCAFSLILSHKSITQKSVSKINNLKNLCLFVLLNDSDQDGLSMNVDYLRVEKCLYGACYYYDNDSFSNIAKNDWIRERLNLIDANFALMIPKSTCDEETINKTYDYVYNSRFETHSPGFMMDLYGDINRIGSIISENSKETHLFSIDSIGQISLIRLENTSKYNIREDLFEEAIKAMG